MNFSFVTSHTYGHGYAHTSRVYKIARTYDDGTWGKVPQGSSSERHRKNEARVAPPRALVSYPGSISTRWMLERTLPLAFSLFSALTANQECGSSEKEHGSVISVPVIKMYRWKRKHDCLFIICYTNCNSSFGRRIARIRGRWKTRYVSNDDIVVRIYIFCTYFFMNCYFATTNL